MRKVQPSKNRTETGQCKSAPSPFPATDSTDERAQSGDRPSDTKPDDHKVRTRLPKTHQDYWVGRLRKRTYLAPDGKTTVQIPTWQVRLFHRGREAWFNLGTANQALAAAKARDTYVFLKANGWDATITKLKPDSDAAPRLDLVVGSYLEAVEKTGYLRPRTFLNYKNCLHTIVSELFGVRGDDQKFDHRAGGNKAWTKRIGRIRLERVTPARVAKWQQRRLKAAGKSPVAVASTKRTINSYVRCARSLFTREIRQRVKDVRLPTVLPFDGVELFEAGSQKYISKVDARALVVAAKNDLKANDPEVYKAFLLGLFGGMRRGEIDLLEWGMIDWENSAIRLEETEFLHLKTSDSAGEITIDPEVTAELREFMPTGNSRFVLSSEVTRKTKKTTRTWTRPPRNDSARPYYRCAPVFKRLTKWLRSKDIKANKPLHEMRKEIGALIATQHGIFAASRFLRHSDITTTARHYADHKQRISVGLGKLLDSSIKPAVEKSA
jgi:integrase